jgi:hypothetical protein
MFCSDDPFSSIRFSSIGSAPVAKRVGFLLTWAFRSAVKAGENNMTVSGRPITMAMPSNDHGHIFYRGAGGGKGGYVTDHPVWSESGSAQPATTIRAVGGDK